LFTPQRHREHGGRGGWGRAGRIRENEQEKYGNSIIKKQKRK